MGKEKEVTTVIRITTTCWDESSGRAIHSIQFDSSIHSIHFFPASRVGDGRPSVVAAWATLITASDLDVVANQIW
jgi:hypothetical protein